MDRTLPFGSAALPRRLQLGARQQLPAFERIARLAARGTGCPMSLVTLLTPDGQWNIGRHGLDELLLPMSSSVCQRVLEGLDPQQVHDAPTDPRLATLELIAPLAGMTFYAGHPVVFRGQAVGMVCVLDRAPRALEPVEATVLADLATIAADHLEAIDSQAMAQLERERAEQFARASGDWFWELDEALRYAWLSPNFEKATGIDPDTLLGRYAGGVRIVPQLLTEDAAPLGPLLQSQQHFSGVLVSVRFHGEPRIVTLSGLALTDGSGRFTGYRGTGRDVTAFVQAVRTAANETVQRKAAEHAAEAKSRFLARASHELRTPLNAILGFSELVLAHGEGVPSVIKQQVGMISQAGEQLLGLVNDVLDLARIEHEPAPQLEPVELATAVQKVLDLLQVDAARRSLRVDNAVPKGLSVRSNARCLNRVLLNVCSNAIKYNRDGGAVNVSVETRVDGRLDLLVRDTGVGIEPQNLSRLFEPFNRLGAHRTEIPGTGLGLVISRSLMNAMDGELRLESTLGIGTTARLELPLDDGQAP